MDASTLRLIEEATFALYNPRGAQDKELAERTLAHHFPTFSESTFAVVSNASPTNKMTLLDSIANCQMLLERSSSPFAQLFAVTQLKALTSNHFPLISLDQKLELRNFVLNFLSQRTDLASYIVTNIAELFGLVTKLGWFDADEFQNALHDISKFLTASPEHQCGGIQLLAMLVSEMNRPQPILRNVARHRKIAVHFRDNNLLNIFQASMDLLSQLLAKQFKYNSATQLTRVQETTVQLIKNCLQFDFIGTNPDESAEDVGSVSFPTSWKPILADLRTYQLIFDAYNSFEKETAGLALECLSMLISCRRSLFNEDERARLLNWTIQATGDILKKLVATNLEAQRECHEFCRLLVRLKVVNQLSEIVGTQSFGEWSEMLLAFSGKTFQSSNFVPNSILYLVTFWSKVAASMPSPPRQQAYLRLEDMGVELVGMFITRRLEAMGAGDDEARNFMEDESTIIHIMEYIAVVARLKYGPVGEFLKNIFDQHVNRYQNIINTARSSSFSSMASHMQDIELLLTWLVYFLGTVVGARAPSQLSDDSELMDAELTARVLNVIDLHGSLIGQRQELAYKNNLDLAILFFLHQFRKSYIHPSIDVKAKEVFFRLGELCGVDDENKMLDLFVQKICSNLKSYPEFEPLITRSIGLFSELASGYSPMKSLRKAESAQMMLKCHDSAYFPFLDYPANVKRRPMYYAILGRLLFAEENVEADALEFLNRFTINLSLLSDLRSPEELRQPRIRFVLDGLFRDLRGFVASIELNEVKPSYLLFFEWFYPYTPLMLRALEANTDHPVSYTILRFMAEITLNRGQRLHFDVSSANGILLFREASKVIQTYGNAAVGRTCEASQKWQGKYKGHTLCLNIFKNCIGGNYVYFGVFNLYNDPVFDDAVEVIFRIILDIPLFDLLSFPKLQQAFFTMMDIFCKEQMMRLKGLDLTALQYIIRALAEGVKSTNRTISTSACNSIEHITTFVFNEGIKNKTPTHFLVDAFSSAPELMHLLITRLFEALFIDEPNDWSLSRPMLPLVLLDKEFFDYFVSKLIQSQIAARQGVLVSAFQELMNGIQFNLSTRNKNQFTQQVLTFRPSQRKVLF